MNENDRILYLVNSLDQIPSCPSCGMRWASGDYECPHCGEDLYENLMVWAENVLNEISDQN